MFDIEGWVKGKILELMHYLGYDWPLSDEGALRTAGQSWRDLQGTLNGYLTELDGAAKHVDNTNEGPGVQALSIYMRSDDSSLESVRNLATAAPWIATGYEAAGIAVTGFKAAVIAEILLDALGLAAAVLSGGLTAAGSFLVKQGAEAAINLLIEKGIAELLGAENAGMVA